MAERARSMEVKVGALILGSVVLLVLFLLLLSDVRLASTQTVRVDFPTTAGLKKGASVKIAGVTVGKIEKIDLWGGRPDPERDNKPVFVRITLNVDEDAMPMLREGMSMRISSAGVLGEKYVEISPGRPDSALIPPTVIHDGVPPMMLDEVGSSAGEMVADLSALVRNNHEDIAKAIVEIRKLSENVNGILTENREDVRHIVVSLRTASESLAVGAGDGSEIRDLLVDTRRLMGRLEKGLGPVADRLPGMAVKLDGLIEKGDVAALGLKGLLDDGGADMRGALKGVRQIVEDLRAGKGNIGALLSDREIYDDLIAIIKEIKRRPWKLLFKD